MVTFRGSLSSRRTTLVATGRSVAWGSELVGTLDRSGGVGLDINAAVRGMLLVFDLGCAIGAIGMRVVTVGARRAQSRRDVGCERCTVTTTRGEQLELISSLRIGGHGVIAFGTRLTLCPGLSNTDLVLSSSEDPTSCGLLLEHLLFVCIRETDLDGMLIASRLRDRFVVKGLDDLFADLAGLEASIQVSL
jgi:hypothetical protein